MGILDVERMLESLGYRVTVCTSSTEALARFKAAPGEVDLLVSDMTMPQMTGAQLARAAMSIRPDLPVILCTGFSRQLTPEQAQQLGIKGYLLKPIAKHELAEEIRKVLDQQAGIAPCGDGA